MRISLVLMLFATVAFAKERKEPSLHVPVRCMQHFTIKDWGKCQIAGNHMTCPKTSIEFDIACEEVGPPKKETEQKTVDYPPTAEVRQN